MELNMQTIKEAQAFYEPSLSLEQVLMQALRLPPLQKIRLGHCQANDAGLS